MSYQYYLLGDDTNLARAQETEDDLLLERTDDEGEWVEDGNLFDVIYMAEGEARPISKEQAREAFARLFPGKVIDL